MAALRSMTRRGAISALVGLATGGCGPTVSTADTVTGAGSGSGADTVDGTTIAQEPGSSSSDDGSSSSGLMICEPDAIACEGSEFGTWRLSSADDQIAAYVYLWSDDEDDETLQFVSRWFVDDEEQEYCTRNGTYVPSGDLGGVFVFQALTQGGTSTAPCGGDPGDHNIRLEMTRRDDCRGHVMALTATDSNGASLYAIEGEAVHCGCDTGYDPYGGQGQPLPVDTCLSP